MRVRVSLVAGVFAVAVAAAAPARAAPSAGCQAERIGGRALVDVTLVQLLDGDLAHLITLGLRGRLHVEATLWRDRRLWFDERIAGQSTTYTVTHEEGRFLLEGAPIPDLGRLRLPPLALVRPGGPLGRAGHHVQVEVRLEVVTAQSLGKVVRWMVGGQQAEGPAPERSRLSRTLLGAVADDLRRTVETSCRVRDRP